MWGTMVLDAKVPPARVKVYSHSGPVAYITFNGLTVQCEDSAVADALGAAFIMAATQLADAKAKA